MCRICQHAHWSTEDHAWTGGAAPKAEPARPKAKAAPAPAPAKPKPSPAVATVVATKGGSDVLKDLKHWRDRALAAEAQLSDIREKQTARQQKLREKRKKVGAKIPIGIPKL